MPRARRLRGLRPPVPLFEATQTASLRVGRQGRGSAPYVGASCLDKEAARRRQYLQEPVGQRPLPLREKLCRRRGRVRGASVIQRELVLQSPEGDSESQHQNDNQCWHPAPSCHVEGQQSSQVPADRLVVRTGAVTRDQSLQLLLHGPAVLTSVRRVLD